MTGAPQTLRWSLDEDTALRTLREKGHSFGLIAKEMNRSREACIGRAHRLGMVGVKADKKVKPRPPVYKTKRVIRDQSWRKNPLKRWSVNTPDSSRNKPLLELGHGECRWPLDGGLWCGSDCTTHKSWCDYHALRGLQAPT